jgi:hypothetical protein
MVFLVIQSTTREQQNDWAQSLAASRNNVLSHLPYQWHAGAQAVGNDLIDLGHVLGHQGQSCGWGG